jgi:hypothetical protein
MQPLYMLASFSIMSFPTSTGITIFDSDIQQVPIGYHRKKTFQKCMQFRGCSIKPAPWVLWDTERWFRLVLVSSKVNQHPPVHHPVDACYDSVMDDPHLNPTYRVGR